MQASLKRITAALRRFRLAQAGAAAVEFALILPVMLLVYVGCNEASTLIILDRKVQTVSGTVGDLVAQSNKSITTMDITDYFRAATASSGSPSTRKASPRLPGPESM
jgi:Flp pilus assembly protein TadG